MATLTKMAKQMKGWNTESVREQAIDESEKSLLKLDYFVQRKLSPIKLQLSSRYVCLLFDSEGGNQNYHVLHRHTHDIIMEASVDAVIRDFYIYDPYDCIKGHDNKDTGAYLIIVLDKKSENGPQQIIIQEISQNLERRIIKHEESLPRAHNLVFGSISPSMKYLAICHTIQLPQEENNGDNNFQNQYTNFYEITHDFNLKYLSSSEPVKIRNEKFVFQRSTFIKEKGQALIITQGVGLQLVNIHTGDILHQIKNTSQKQRVVYYLDQKQYFLHTLDTSEEWSISFDEENRLKLKEEVPLAYFDANKTEGLCIDENPYQYAMRKMLASCNTAQISGFIIANKFFNLNMDDIKFSRAIFLPDYKAFYCIKNSDQHECYALDLNNLQIPFLTTLTNAHRPPQFGTCKSLNDGSLIIDDLSYQFLDQNPESSMIQSLSQFFMKTFKGIYINFQEVNNFQVFGHYLILKISTHIHIYDMILKKEILCALGTNVQFSFDLQAFILNRGAFQYSYFKWNETEQVFKEEIPLLKFVILRVDFLPETNDTLAILNEENKQLFCYNTNEQKVIFKLVTFSTSEYNLISKDLISYTTTIVKANKKQKQTKIYNINGEFEEVKFSKKETILLTQLSQCKKYLYVTSSENLKVYKIDDLLNILQTFATPDIVKIEETEELTYLIGRYQNTTKIYPVKSLNPQKVSTQNTSGKFLSKYIFEKLKNKESTLEEIKHCLTAYATFHRLGMIDTYFGIKGASMLHFLIDNHSSQVLQFFFDSGFGAKIYTPTYKDVTPMRYAYKKQKMQHLQVMLRYFIENNKNIIIQSEDFKFLMECPLPEASTFITTLFKEPSYHKCQLQFNLKRDEQVFLEHQSFLTLGHTKAQEIEKELQTEEAEQNLFQYTVSKFKYNFERGSQSSIDFLQAYANSESEEVIRSNLRLIIEYKFNECYGFLKLQAILFFIFLIVLLLKIVYFNESILAVIILLAFNTIFFGYEVNQLMKSGFSNYFDSIWNYADMSGFILLYIVYIALPFLSEENQDLITFPTAIAIMLLLLRGMSYLRIFSNLRYLINMVIEIIKDMSSFFTLLVYWILGLTVVFYLFLKNAQVEEGQDLFIDTLKSTYTLAFGDFQTDNYGTPEWIVFLITSLFIPLVMFNLLIAIMGDTYGRVKEQSQSVDLKERADLILEVESLMYWKRNVNEENKQHLFIAYPQSLSEDEGEQLESKVQGLQKSLNKIQTKISEVFEMKKEIINTLRDEIRSLKQ